MTRRTLRGCFSVAVAILWAGEAALAGHVFFRRGDSNVDGVVNISDPTHTLNYLFTGSASLDCADAADANDDGEIDITDPVFTLGYLFTGVNPEPPSPGPSDCGYDPTPDEHYCAAYFVCTQPIVFFEVIDGFAIIEGDISIGRPEDIPLDIIGIGVGAGGGFATREQRDANGFFGNRWPQGVVPFTIDPALTDRGRVTDAIEHWESKTFFRFVDRTTEPDFVTFMAGDGCFSALGMTGGQQFISLGKDCSTGNAIHEIGHTVGLFHEQARPDRDQYVKINFGNIQAGLSSQFDKQSGVFYCKPYDYGSIMHYGGSFFSKNGKPTIETIPSGISIGQRDGLSARDVEIAGYLYAPRYNGWSTMEGVATSDVAVGRNADGRLEIFVTSSDNGVWHRWQLAPNADWSDWSPLEGNLIGAPAVGSNEDGRLEVFQRDAEGSVWQRFQLSPGGDWSLWNPLFGTVTSDIAVGRNDDGRLEIFATGPDGGLWHRWQVEPNGDWSSWSSLEGNLIGKPAVGSNEDGRLEVFQRATDGSVWQRFQVAPGGDWSLWNPLFGSVKSDIGIGRNIDGRLEIFAIGNDDGVWHRWQLAPNGDWSDWSPLGGGFQADAPAVGANSDGRLEVFVRGFENAIWHNWQLPEGGWAGWNPLAGNVLGNVGVGTNADGRLELFVRAVDGAVYQNWQTACTE